MHRALALILVVVLAACDKKEPDPKVRAHRGNPPPTLQNPPKSLPTTGNPRMREAREDILQEVEKAEKDLAAGTKPDPMLLANWKKQTENLIAVAEMAIGEEALQAARHDLTQLRTKQAELDKKRADMAEGIREVQGYLDAVEKGGRVPEGFTADELKDRLGELQEEARAIDKEDEQVRAALKEKEDIVNSGKATPEGATLHTNERDALQELRKRIEAIEAKTKG